MVQQSKILKYEPSSEPLHISAKYLGHGRVPSPRGQREGGARVAVPRCRVRACLEVFAAHLVVPSSLVGPVKHSIRALSGHLKFPVRRHKFNEHSLVLEVRVQGVGSRVHPEPFTPTWSRVEGKFQVKIEEMQGPRRLQYFRGEPAQRGSGSQTLSVLTRFRCDREEISVTVRIRPCYQW